MYSSAILDVTEHKFVGKTTVNEEIYEGFSVITLPNKKRVLKKFLKAADKNYIIKNGEDDRNLFKGKMKLFSEISIETVLCIIDKLCRVVAKDYSKKLPFEEITVISDCHIGLQIVEKLKNEAKLFTLVTDCEDRLLADELYFKYGLVIRYKQFYEESKSIESLVISSDELVAEKVNDCPVINLSERDFAKRNVINIGNVIITDKNISAFSKYWNGCPGPEIYTLLNILPQEYSTVEINKKTDSIFLLDTDAF